MQTGKLEVPLSLTNYITDHTSLIDQIFTILTGDDIEGMLPDILKVGGLDNYVTVVNFYIPLIFCPVTIKSSYIIISHIGCKITQGETTVLSSITINVFTRIKENNYGRIRRYSDL